MFLRTIPGSGSAGTYLTLLLPAVWYKGITHSSKIASVQIAFVHRHVLLHSYVFSLSCYLAKLNQGTTFSHSTTLRHLTLSYQMLLELNFI